MIVKNESHIIVKTLNNLCEKIDFSYWVICDTGSTDNTKELIIDFFKEKNIQGELIQHEWRDFGHNRTLALESAYNKTDLLFIFDADDEIVGNLVLPHIYEHDGYTFNFGNDVVYIRPLLINNRKRWRFVGVLHEYLACSENSTPHKNIEGDYYIVSGRSGNRSQNPNKYFDDANILKKAHYDVLESDYGLSCRYAFYCAQSYKDSGYMDESIEWYKKCLDLNMWLQEKYVSAFAIGNMYMAKNDMKNALKYWYKTIEYDPERIEGIINAINYLTKEGEHLLVNALYHRFKNYSKKLVEKLFMVDLCYKDQLEYNNVVSAFYANDKQSGYECCKKIFLNRLVHDNLMKATISNFLFYIDLFNEEKDTIKTRLFYLIDDIICGFGKKNEEIESNMITCWNILFDKCKHLLCEPNSHFISHLSKKSMENSSKETIMITFTTCKRLELFKQTVYSILNHWLDVKSIGTWFCVDDNSDDDDRKQMQSLFPWIQYYMKTGQEKGHRNSMNIIWNKLNEVKPKYWIHMEDDFLFHRKMNYIEEGIKALNSNECSKENVKQVLFNRNYGEIIEHYNSRGHVSISNDLDVTGDIVMHKHCDGVFNYMNCHYWPHYSFRPSIIDASVILKLGNYDSENQFFEMDYAKKWSEKGYKSAFFNKITCRHIGRLTSDRNTKTVKNAYDLNNEQQFVSKSKEESDLTERTYGIETVENNNAFIKIVNLERRSDRKKDTMKKLVDSGISSEDYEFIKAIDGALLKPTSELKHLFRNNDFGSRRGVIGCALSHYNLWKRLVNDSQHEYYVIMEDDFVLCSNFKKQLEALKSNNDFVLREVLFLGYHMFEKNRNYNVYNLVSESVAVAELNKDFYIGGTFMYSINKTGAKKIIDYIDKHGINHGIDYQIKIISGLQCFESQPQIVFSDWNENGKKIDSDIQNTFDSIDFTGVPDVSVENDKNAQNIKADFVFIPGLDVIGCDLYMRNGSLEEKFLTAIGDSECVGFNTLGFFKDDVIKLQPSGYFKEGDGIYIKKQVYEEYLKLQKQGPDIIRLKMLCNWTDSKQLCKEWSNMCEPGLRFCWKNYRMVWTDRVEDIDYYVIVNRPPDGAYYDPKKTIVFQMEPWVYDENKPWGVKTWCEWAEPDENKFMHVHNHKKYLNNVQWLNTIPELSRSRSISGSELQLKNRVMSIISEKNFDEGHIKRIEFIRYMESSMNCDFVDVYGRQNYHNFLTYKGTVENDNKYMNYKYCISVENNSEYNYATEKIWEPILCECLCFYWGCPNIRDYIDDRAFVLLDMNNFEKSCETIKRAIEEDWWSERIDIIRKEKAKILNELAFFPTLDRIIHNKPVISNYFTNTSTSIQCNPNSPFGKVFICGCVKNNSKYLHDVFKNINNIAKLFNDYKIIIAYDDSNDNSLDILHEMSKYYKMEILKCDNKSPYVCENICQARNTILQYIRNENDSGANYMIFMDMDDVCADNINIENIETMLHRNEEWDAISFNRDDYYDIWALSLDEYVISCQHWENWMDVASTMKKYIKEKLGNLNENELLEVYSAFNGFAIYKIEKFINCNYECNFQNNLSYFTETIIKNNARVLDKVIKKELVVDCEHRHFHLDAIKKNDAKIRVSPLNLIKTKIKWEIIGPEIKNDSFYHNIINLIKNSNDIKNILEIGASSGEGSTEAFIVGKNSNSKTDIKLFSIEVSNERYELLKDRYKNEINFYPYNYSSIKLNDFPSRENIIEFYNSTPTKLNGATLETVLSWYDNDKAYIKLNSIEDDGINKIKNENNISYFDCVLIDGSEFTGYKEFELIYGAKYILLDDINTYKCYIPHKILKNDVHYKCLIENMELRNGFSIFERKQEDGSKYVCSRGILKSCHIKTSAPFSSTQKIMNYNFDDLKDGSTVYVCSNAIKDFINIFDTIDKKIILVTGDCDETVPNDIFKTTDEFISFIESDKIIHWFSQNCIGKHPKLTGIPIGLDYHTMANNNDHEWGTKKSPFEQELQLEEIKKAMLPFCERKLMCYSNFHFFTTTRYGYDRIEAINNIPKDLVFYEDHKIKRVDSWRNQSEYAFVISPHGNGLDCHRTWEALCLGCIPIVKTSDIDYLYDNLPVLIVNSWSDVTFELLSFTIDKFKDLHNNNKFDYNKLVLSYWVNKINNV